MQFSFRSLIYYRHINGHQGSSRSNHHSGTTISHLHGSCMRLDSHAEAPADLAHLVHIKAASLKRARRSTKNPSCSIP